MTLLRFIRQLISVLSTTVEAHSISLRLFLLAAQISDECGFEDFTYELYVHAFTVYEDSINDSRAQLQAITLIINTLQGAKVFNVDNYDVLITKAALHGAKLLKKPHQSTAVHMASHMWWQTRVSSQDTEPEPEPASTEPKATEPSEETPAAPEQAKGVGPQIRLVTLRADLHMISSIVPS